jgi:monoterpene epsilon-lactone hydrolase
MPRRRWHWRLLCLNLLLRTALKKRFKAHVDPRVLRRRVEKIDARLARVDPSVRRRAVACDGVGAEWIEVPQSRAERVILYLHGGGFALRVPNVHAGMAARWCRRLGARTLMPDYRLAPEHPFPAAPEDCLTAYRWLLAQGITPGNVVIAGDSAGGCLALAVLHGIKSAGWPLPKCAVLLSPAADMELAGPSLVGNEKADPMFRPEVLTLLRDFYVRPDQYQNPLASPLRADYHGFPPLLLQVGSTEMLLNESTRVAEKAHDSGVHVVLEIWQGMPHVFQAISYLPESRHAERHIVDFIRAHAGWDQGAGQGAAVQEALLDNAGLPPTAMVDRDRAGLPDAGSLPASQGTTAPDAGGRVPSRIPSGS